ncbi:MAG: hypothetical protein VKJ66_11350 [Synechococcus sp.]|nr:hypothetical protein [Synechococcus sp.]
MGWSVLAIRQRRLLPPQIQGRHLVAAAIALLLLWILRLSLQFGLGVPAFPDG